MAKTTKTCEVMQYMKYVDTDIAGIEERIKALTNLKTYALILHDKDKKADGSAKEPHFHAVLTFTDAKTWQSIAKGVGVEVQYVNKIKTTTKRAQDYLVHKHDPDKYQYDPAEVRANFDYAEKMEDTKVSISIENVISRIEAEEIKPYSIYEAVDANTYAKHKLKIDRAFEYVQNKKRSVNRNMECIYIYGDAGTGKTTLAKHFAASKGFHAYVSSGGKNPLDNYQGEECIILDDIRGSVFPLADFLKLTDNNTDSLVGCRYYNKSISYCKLIICTSVKSVEELYSGVTDAEKEPLKQLYRRFANVIRLDGEKMYFYAYNDKTENLQYLGMANNPVAMLFNPVVAHKTIQAFSDAFGLELKQIKEAKTEDQKENQMKDRTEEFVDAPVETMRLFGA